MDGNGLVRAGQDRATGVEAEVGKQILPPRRAPLSLGIGKRESHAGGRHWAGAHGDNRAVTGADVRAGDFARLRDEHVNVHLARVKRSEENTSELQSRFGISYAVF